MTGRIGRGPRLARVQAMNLRATSIALLSVSGLVAGGCGDTSTADTTPAGATAPTAPAQTSTTPQPAGTATGVKGLVAQIGTDLQTAPAITRPSGDPPGRLVVRDLVSGKGRAARQGDMLTVNYLGASWSNGVQFDSSFQRGQPITFQLGAQMVIPGWDQGLKGVRAGGRRLLVIPPGLAYGAQGTPDIAPNETLVFVLDVVDVGTA